MINVLYFARLREQLDTESEQLDIAAGSTLADVLTMLRSRGGVWADTFAEDQLIMMAVNQEMTEIDAAVSEGDEVAFFPPVTGG
ncbi:MAG: molybdopterin converting factor subunit 1 [Chromatiales bacterium]|nr:molybdopterin converting factor subunit 1 [Chromatiales bacterium]